LSKYAGGGGLNNSLHIEYGRRATTTMIHMHCWFRSAGTTTTSTTTTMAHHHRPFHR